MNLFNAVAKKELVLYDYQDDCIDGLRDGFRRGNRSQMLYLGTGGGKTEVAIKIADLAAKENNKTAIISDRRILVNQLSERFDKYGVEHGVQMAGHWRRDPEQKIQLCSAQTLEAYGSMPDFSLMIIDEAHRLRKSIKNFIKANARIKIIGLSASPFTNGLIDVFSNVVSKITTSELVGKGQLTPLKVFIAKEIDMTGAKKIAGEWSDKEVTERGVKIIGDVVLEWQKKTLEIFGAPRKTIVFCAGVAHGVALAEEFKSAGYNFVSVSYKDDDEFKAATLKEFNKPDGECSIHGLIATDLLTEGFDQPDVMIGVMARPFSKSFSSFIQQIGRLMRRFPGKEFAVLNDHSGNYLRFQEDWEELYNNGVIELVEGKEKAKKEPTDEKKDAAKCPKCGGLWETSGDVCTHCGYIRVRKNEVVALPGEMLEVSIGASKNSPKINKDDLYNQICSYARTHGEPDKQRYRANHLYRKFTGEDYPDFVNAFDKAPSVDISSAVSGKIRQLNIAFARSMKK